ncbi:MAG TPA: hypothetical protein V6D00_00110 [Pantanalinema sp.]
MRFSRLLSLFAATCCALTPLTGCVIRDFNTVSTGYAAGSTAKRAPAYDMDGSTLFDAYHAVQRYLSLHYPDADLVRVQAQMVGTNGRVAKTSAWEFTYRVQVQALAPTPSASASPAPGASASYRAQAVVPSTFKYRLLNFVYTGKGDLLAPEEQDDTGDTLASVDFPRTILLGKAIETALDIGMGVGAPGMAITLRTTVNGGAVYELDSSVATRQTLAAQKASVYGPYYGDAYYDDEDVYYYDSGSSYGGKTGNRYDWDVPQDDRYVAPKTSYVRGKYLLDAYTGAIIERPNKL